MGGSLAPVRVAGFTWNGWQPSAVYAVFCILSKPSADFWEFFYSLNACSMRAHGMEPKAQCNGRRRACVG